MSATSLSRKSGIRAASGAPRVRVNTNALPRPTQSSSLNINVDDPNSSEQSLSSASTASEQRHYTEEPQEQTEDEKDKEEEGIEIALEEQDIHTRLLNDHFSRAYRPSFHSTPALNSFGSPTSPSPPDVNVAVVKGTSRPPGIVRLRPNTVHQETLVGPGNVYDYHEHGFPMPPRSLSSKYSAPEPHQPIPQQPQHLILAPQSPPQSPPQYPRPLLQYPQAVPRQRGILMNRALSRSKIPPRRESMWIALHGETDGAAFAASESQLDENPENVLSPREGLGLVQEVEVEQEDTTSDDYSEYDSQESDDQEYIQKFQLQDPPTRDVYHEEVQEHSQYEHQHKAHQLHDTPVKRSLSPVPPLFPAPPQRPRTPILHSDMPVSTGPVKHYTHEIETRETLKRERTRILQRTVVNSYRQISYEDISNIQPLKRGGFGEIHTAEWSRLQVVLKRALVDHNEGVEQFDQELEILKRVHDYDFIVPFYGVTIISEVSKPDIRCMVMKYCSNGNLCSFLEKNHATLTWGERYRLSIEITKGLEFLHKSGFHHRDLHSGNILLDDKRTAMICDFGLSRSSNKEQTCDLTAAVGVASFLAPERFPTKRPIYSAACDIYSLGVIFWHISSGRIPFAKRLRDPLLLNELMEGCREVIVQGTPEEYKNMLVKCWDVNPVRRLKIDVIIGVLQTLMAEPSAPGHQVATGFTVPSNTTSAALPVPPELGSKMASLERASNTLNQMVIDIKDPAMQETVNYIKVTRAFFRDQSMPSEPYSRSNPPKTPIYLCPLVGDIAGLDYHLSQYKTYNPINESSEQTGDTALHLACLFLESPLDMIKVLVELGADINLENLQGYTPVMILVTSNTQYCYEALKYFVMRGARIPAYIRNPITPLNNAQIYALNLVNESRQLYLSGTGATERRRPRDRAVLQNKKGTAERNARKTDHFYAHGRPLIHVVAAMQDDYRILDCLCEAVGLDAAIKFGGETALVAAAAHLRIKNVEWLLNNDLEISSGRGISRAIKVVRMLYSSSPSSPTDLHFYGQGTVTINASYVGTGGRLATPSIWSKLDPTEFPEDVRDLGKYSWAGVAYRDCKQFNKDMVGPVLQLLDQWTGSGGLAARKDVATKLRLTQGISMTSPVVVVASAHSDSDNNTVTSPGGTPYIPPPPPANHGRVPVSNNAALRKLSQRKNQRPLIDQVLNGRPGARFW